MSRTFKKSGKGGPLHKFEISHNKSDYYYNENSLNLFWYKRRILSTILYDKIRSLKSNDSPTKLEIPWIAFI